MNTSNFGAIFHAFRQYGPVELILLLVIRAVRIRWHIHTEACMNAILKMRSEFIIFFSAKQIKKIWCCMRSDVCWSALKFKAFVLNALKMIWSFGDDCDRSQSCISMMFVRDSSGKYYENTYIPCNELVDGAHVSSLSSRMCAITYETIWCGVVWLWWIHVRIRCKYKQVMGGLLIS